MGVPALVRREHATPVLDRERADEARLRALAAEHGWEITRPEEPRRPWVARKFETTIFQPTPKQLLAYLTHQVRVKARRRDRWQKQQQQRPQEEPAAGLRRSGAERERVYAL